MKRKLAKPERIPDNSLERERERMHGAAQAVPITPCTYPWRGGEISMAALKPTSKIGFISVKPLGDDRWELRWTDPKTRLQVKKRVKGSRSEIDSVASHLNSECLSGRGYLPGQRKLPSLKDALAEAIRLSRGSDKHKVEMGYWGGRWIEWMTLHHPKVRDFSGVKPYMLTDYVRGLEKEGKAHDTVRLALVPVKMAWRFANENYPEEVRPLPKIRQKARPRREIISLEADEIEVLMDWLSEKAPDLHPIALMQAFCGLRTLEAVSVRRQDVDLQRGLLRVTDTEHHRLKNAGSERTIPMPSFVLSALAEAINRQRVIPADGSLFQTSNRTPWTKTSLQSRWRRIRANLVKETGNPRYGEVPPKKLRSSFATMASRLGVPDRLVKAYMGHAAGDILGSHYRAIDPSELRQVSGAMEEWQTLISRGSELTDSGTTLLRIAVSD